MRQSQEVVFGGDFCGNEMASESATSVAIEHCFESKYPSRSSKSVQFEK
jgi:hypothetical protein